MIHWLKPKSAQRRPLQNYFHALLGITVIGLAFYQVRTGYKHEWVHTTGREALPKAVDIVWYIWVAVRLPHSHLRRHCSRDCSIAHTCTLPSRPRVPPETIPPRGGK